MHLRYNRYNFWAFGCYYYLILQSINQSIVLIQEQAHIRDRQNRRDTCHWPVNYVYKVARPTHLFPEEKTITNYYILCGLIVPCRLSFSCTVTSPFVAVLSFLWMMSFLNISILTWSKELQNLTECGDFLLSTRPTCHHLRQWVRSFSNPERSRSI